MENTKGLADGQEGEFILNESGTSVSTGADGETAPFSDVKKEGGKNEDDALKGSSGAEEKDITD